MKHARTLSRFKETVEHFDKEAGRLIYPSAFSSVLWLGSGKYLDSSFMYGVGVAGVGLTLAVQTLAIGGEFISRTIEEKTDYGRDD